MDDVPLAGERAQLGAERLVGIEVLVVGGVLVDRRLGGVREGLRSLDLVDDARRSGDLVHEVLVEHGLVGLAVDVGPVVRGDLVRGLGGVFGRLFGEGVIEDLGGSLGLAGLVDLESVVHDRVRLRVGDLDVAEVGDIVVLVIHDVDGVVLGGVGRVLLRGEHVALLGFVVLARLLGSRRPIGVVDISFRHW
ncbi:hypothetical protein SRABI128_01447 [Microbacterium sp. Bi128]|nr:hypothetical protein SRABI128_01447 [Microbacterium sp. Bi128]